MTAPAAVRERGIIFTGESVRAILDGSKTQTRRVLKCQPLYKSAMYYVMPDDAPKAWQDCSDVIRLCPYGRVGDRLWVRETWRAWATVGAGTEVRAEYQADGAVIDRHLDEWSVPRSVAAGGWGPSIFMPRWACRLVLELTDVRVERVQAISEEDARAEGVGREAWPEDCTPDDAALSAECGYSPPRSHGAAFANLWDSLNAKRGYGWDVNPWVWALSFRRVEP